LNDLLDIAPENGKFKPGNSQKNALIDKDLKDPEAGEKHYPLLIRASCGDLKVSSQVNNPCRCKILKDIWFRSTLRRLLRSISQY